VWLLEVPTTQESREPSTSPASRQGTLTCMAKGWSLWRDGRRAWSRLQAWGPGDPGARSGLEMDSEEALRALTDVGLLRRLLDQAELTAVRTARVHGKSWAEIATRLGVTRQSAWERWRELDEPAVEPPDVEMGRHFALRVAAEAAAEMSDEAAGELRRRSTVTVPHVIGMAWDEARHLLLDRRLVAVGPDPDGPPLAASGWPAGIVVDQSPESGAKVPPGSSVTLWLEAGGGGGDAGVREPRRPSPNPKSARAMREEPSDEAVG
jgi:hypothetical protein